MQAQQILEHLIANPQQSVDADRLLLARVYEEQGNLQAARGQWVSLVERAEPNPRHLAQHVDFLLRNDDTAAAEAKLQKLDALAPDDLAVMRLRARWLLALDRSSEIEPLVEGLADKLLQKAETDKVQVFLSVGALYSSVQLHQPAERWYRQLVQLAPEQYGPLALTLSRQGRMKEAISLCAEAAKSDSSSRPAAILVSVLTAGQPTKEDLQLAEPVLAESIERHKNDPALLFSIANARITQHRIDDAVVLYQQVLQLNPKHLLALNNLATLLAEQPAKSQEALGYVDRAIKIAGEQPGLLDTKGMILVHSGNPRDAVPLLNAAASTIDADPRYHFHLAVAYFRLGDLENARAAHQKARDGNLAAQFLTQVDKDLLAELDRALAQ